MKTIGFAPCLRLLSAAVLLCAALLHSQTFTGTISGIVSDGSGAVLTGAAITVTDLATNTTQRPATNETGFYVTSGLAPGVYRITAEKSGFRTYVLDSMPLSTQQKASIDITLDIGAVTENVQVQAQAQMVDPTSSTLGTVVENKRIIDLPLNGRQIYSLAALVPGVFNVRTGSDGMTADFTSAHRFIVNGGQESTTDILLDGVTALVSSNNSTLFSVGAIPSVEGVQEFKIQTNAFFGGVRKKRRRSGNDGHQVRLERATRQRVRVSAQQLFRRQQLLRQPQRNKARQFQKKPVRSHGGRAGFRAQGVQRP